VIKETVTASWSQAHLNLSRFAGMSEGAAERESAGETLSGSEGSISHLSKQDH
jgi:hypothetical protein